MIDIQLTKLTLSRLYDTSVFLLTCFKNCLPSINFFKIRWVTLKKIYYNRFIR